MKISSFVIGFLVVALITVTLGLYVTGIKINYATVDYNESELGGFNKIEEIQNLSSDLNQSLQQVEQGSVIDIVGGLITSGFTVLKTTWSSFGIYTDVVNEASDNIPLGDSGVTIKAIALMLGILLFIFAMVTVLIGRDV